jgi:hypothetical protein
MRSTKLGRWVARVMVLGVLGIAVVAGAGRFYTPNDTEWLSPSTQHAVLR